MCTGSSKRCWSRELSEFAGRLTPMFRVLAQPRWSLGLLIATSAAVGFMLLGLWQLDRHNEQQARTTALSDQELVVGLANDATEYQLVEVSGAWQPGSTFEVVPRNRNGVLGASVVSILRTDSGPLLAVERGWTEDIGGLPEPIPLEPVTVVGRLIESQGVGTDALAPRRYGRLDLDAFAADLGAPLFGLALVADSIVPDSSGLVTDLDLVPSSTPHLSYAYQWFAFSTIVLIGFALLLRKVAK